jgi:hypothetical protein
MITKHPGEAAVDFHTDTDEVHHAQLTNRILPRRCQPASVRRYTSVDHHSVRYSGRWRFDSSPLAYRLRNSLADG